jgi:ribosomal protein S27E
MLQNLCRFALKNKIVEKEDLNQQILLINIESAKKGFSKEQCDLYSKMVMTTWLGEKIGYWYSVYCPKCGHIQSIKYIKSLKESCNKCENKDTTILIPKIERIK